MNTKPGRKLTCGRCAAMCSVCLVTAALSYAADSPPPAQTTAQATPKAQPATQPTAQPTTNPALQLRLSARDLDSIIAKHRAVTATSGSSQLEEVVVTSPTELLPVVSPTREVWGGLAAPFWAIVHPTQAWRIFAPIPAE
jgi:hypothetical protein